MSSFPYSGGRAATVAAFAGAAVLLAAVPAFAHVTVQPGTAAKGSYSTVAFKVPNEQDSASTIKVEVNLPADHPIASVSLQPVPGWTAKVTTSKLATPAEDGRRHGQPGRHQDHLVGREDRARGSSSSSPSRSARCPTDADSLVFKTLQTYDNGESCAGSRCRRPGAPEPREPGARS